MARSTKSGEGYQKGKGMSEPRVASYGKADTKGGDSTKVTTGSGSASGPGKTGSGGSGLPKGTI